MKFLDTLDQELRHLLEDQKTDTTMGNLEDVGYKISTVELPLKVKEKLLAALHRMVAKLKTLPVLIWWGRHYQLFKIGLMIKVQNSKAFKSQSGWLFMTITTTSSQASKAQNISTITQAFLMVLFALKKY
ncbi:MAG: hypothetical protein HUJ13_03780 [Hydrogenovibrio crunogenus]|uniref:Uncharacterized protein n=1 Tax=Hydrogenovibrio crunogenus (strain DSM 25203 / XCL-2) TaxID=317025 RepID=Q31IQ8_HYDCU|nr:hypothetical protein [Hydrogenovibrio crunogenus]